MDNKAVHLLAGRKLLIIGSKAIDAKHKLNKAINNQEYGHALKLITDIVQLRKDEIAIYNAQTEAMRRNANE